ncbi:hypothetical protein FKP32DRAFT_1578831, partial [Trametes sanguinea]
LPMDAEHLPQYSRNPTTTQYSSNGHRTGQVQREHLYHLTSARGPWLTLTVFSNAPTSNHLPAFYQGESVRGSVTLRLDREEAIKSVSVQIFGQMTSSVTDVLNFLHVSQVLWPPTPMPDPAESRTSASGKLVGEYSWPFSLTLPEQCELKSSNGSLDQYPLPASFSERLARVHIQYQIVVTVHRSRFRVDSTLGTVIGYCPIIRPDAPSPARQIAYIENSPLIGPDGDPDGWECLAPLRIHGSVFSARAVEAISTLALAKPLCYTRGSVIPCLLTIETADPQALLLLSAPRSPVVRLVRRISTQEATAGSVGLKKFPSLEYESTVQEISTAIWWPDRANDAGSSQKRVLHGEIQLSSSLKPSCRLGKFELSVAVAFQPHGEADAVLQRQPVIIGTAYASGPRPRMNSPPGYDDTSSAGHSAGFGGFH